MRSATGSASVAGVSNSAGACGGVTPRRPYEGLAVPPVQRLSDEQVRANRAMGMSMRIRCGVDRYIILREVARAALVRGNCFRMVGGNW